MKKKFIENLRKYLSPLNDTEREEIIAFYEERFQTGKLYEGKTEEEICDELESPKQIAKNVLEEYGYEYKEPTPINTLTNNINVWAVIGVILLDLFFISWFIPLLFSLLLGFGAGFIGLVGYVFQSIITADGAQYGAAIVLGLGIGFFWILFILWLYDVMINFILWVVRIHMDAFKVKDTHKFNRKMRKMRSDYIIRNNPVLSRTKRLGTIIALVLIVSGVVLYSTNDENRYLVGSVGEVTEYTENFEIDDFVLSIETALEIGTLHVVYHSQNELMIEIFEGENYPHTINFEDNVLTIENGQARRFPWLFFDFTSFTQRQLGVTVYVPENTKVNSVKAENMNGSVTIEDLDVNAVDVNLTNGAVYIRNAHVASSLNVKTTNGLIHFQDLTVDTSLRAQTTNGEVRMDRVHANSYEIESTNGAIRLNFLNDPNEGGTTLTAKTTNGRIRLENVYVYDVSLRTTNGNVDYYNTDRSFRLNRVAATTTNGDTNIDVPRN